MGKIRIKTLGEEKAEKIERQKAKARAEAKKAEKQSSAVSNHPSSAGLSEVPEIIVKETENPQTDNKKKKTDNKRFSAKAREKKHSPKYLAALSLVDKKKLYSLEQALELLPRLKLAKFDETVELHINTLEKGVSGSVSLPHGTGKQIRVMIANQTDNPKQVEELVKNIEAGKIEFDVLIATPETMSKLAKVARFLGPRGLMPNPKNGTVNKNPEEIAKKYRGGQVNFKTEAKFPILHLAVGKVSFGEKKLADNIKTAIGAVQTKNVKTITLKSTMSPGIKLDTASL